MFDSGASKLLCYRNNRTHREFGAVRSRCASVGVGYAAGGVGPGRSPRDAVRGGETRQLAQRVSGYGGEGARLASKQSD